MTQRWKASIAAIGFVLAAYACTGEEKVSIAPDELWECWDQSDDAQLREGKIKLAAYIWGLDPEVGWGEVTYGQ